MFLPMLQNNAREVGGDLQHRLMTEYEWRRMTKRRTRRRPDWWGAQCLYLPSKCSWIGKRRDRVFYLGISLILAFLMPALFPAVMPEEFDDVISEIPIPVQVRKVSAIGYEYPASVQSTQHTYHRTQLSRGKMMLLDENHFLPQEQLPPNTVNIAQYAGGMVPVRSLAIRTGYETIEALKSLFAALKQAGISNIALSAGTVSAAQQRQILLKQTRSLMERYPPEEAANRALDAFERPGEGSLLLDHVVEITCTDGREWRASMEGQTFLQLCWRFGFVQESSHRPNRFRYVGKAHATAMTYLDLELKPYLEWLQLKGCLTISEGGRLKYLIVSRPMRGDYAVFDLPAYQTLELSTDNMGYAIAACTL